MNKFIYWITLVPVGVVIIVFSMVNRGGVEVNFWPFLLQFSVPLFALILVSLMIGVLWGGVAAWLAAGRARKKARDMSRRAELAELEVRHLEERNARLEQDAKKARGEQSTALNAPADAA